MLKYRFITAGIVAAILIPLIIFGRDSGIALLVAVFSSIALWEIVRCFPEIKALYSKIFTLLLGLCSVFVFYWLPFQQVTSILVWLPLIVILYHLFLYNRVDNTINSAGQMILALFYVTIPLCHAIPLVRIEQGVAWVLFVLVVNSLGDAGAYFLGKYIGKHHFSKHVSPGKTIEGILGGFLGNFLGMLIIKIIFSDIANWTFLLKITFVIGIAGPLGDLCASVIKRRLGIKDYGHILPGHGGVMDRADSLILVFPTVFYYLLLIGMATPK
jgi:phosphatidate cytidylyltransferase